MIVRRALAIACVVAVGMAVPAAAAPVITDLGLLPGATQASAHDMNNAGVIVGYSGDFSGNVRGVRWNANGMTNLGTLPGAQSSLAHGINDAGTIVGTSGGKAVRWNTDGTMATFASLPGYDYTWAVDINDSGIVIGNSFINFVGRDLAVRWIPRPVSRELDPPGELRRAPQILQPLPGDAVSWASAINSAGTVVGRSFGGSRNHAVRWKSDGTAVALPTLPGTTASEAYGINKHGVIVGTVFVDDVNTHAVRWNLDGSITDLGTLPGHSASVAYDISDNGVIVGRSESEEYAPVQWIPNGSISELGTLPQDNWGQARAVNNTGVSAGESGGIRAVRWSS